tara:strand:- start:475 stop:1365 length:891 start_codon:yes stop_codon:yes gene_type:complete
MMMVKALARKVTRMSLLYLACFCWSCVGRSEVLIEDFSNGFGLFSPLTPESWANEEEGEEEIAALMVEGVDREPVRRPREFMLLEKQVWKDYDFRLRACSSEDSSVSGRDVVMIFGYQDFSHFYYAHISSDNSARVHNVIMKVDGEIRSVITDQEFPETRLTDGWHDIRVVHLSDGVIRVYVDDMGLPLMTAFDETFPMGGVGFGCFDDAGKFDDFRIEGEFVRGDYSMKINSALNVQVALSGAVGELYPLEESIDLEEWNLYYEILDDGSALYTIPVNLDRYYRIRAELPLLPKF